MAERRRISSGSTFEEQIGYARAVVDGELIDLQSPPALARRQNHDISLVVDRLVVRSDDRQRLADSIETALRTAAGVVQVNTAGVGSREQGTGNRGEGAEGGQGVESHLFSEHYACAACGISIPELEPRQFSFNSPYGACPACGGLGTRREPNPELVIGDSSVSILEGVKGVAVARFEASDVVRHPLVERIVKAYDADAARRLKP